MSDRAAAFSRRRDARRVHACEPIGHTALRGNKPPCRCRCRGSRCAIRVRFPPLKDSDLVIKVLSTTRWRVATSPVLLEKFPAPKVPVDLSRLPTLALGRRGPSTCCIWMARTAPLLQFTTTAPRHLRYDRAENRCCCRYRCSSTPDDDIPKRSSRQVDGLCPNDTKAGPSTIFSSRDALPSVRALIDSLRQFKRSITMSQLYLSHAAARHSTRAHPRRARRIR